MGLYQNLEKQGNRLRLVTPRLIRKKPLFLLRALYRQFSEKTYLKDPIRGVLFASTYKCNLSCVHCYEKKLDTNPKAALTLEEKKRVIAECLDLGAISFDFVGGETSQDPHFPELLQACKPYKTYISLTSNGYDYDDERIKKFRDMGVDKLNISIDSWFSKEHDEFRRKPGSHANAWKTIALCKKHGLDVNIGMVVSANSTKTEGFKLMVEYAIKTKTRLAFIAAVPLGEWEGAMETLITEDDKKTMRDLHDKYPFLTRDNFNNRHGGCPAFNEILTITPYGDIMPCDFMHISFGNIKEQKLKDVVAEARKLKYFSGRYNGCIAAENKGFIAKYLKKSTEKGSFPVAAEDIFKTYKGPAPGRDLASEVRN